MPRSWSTKPERTIGLELAAGLCSLSFGVLLASCVIVFMTCTLSGGIAALVSLCCFERLPSDDFFVLLIIIPLDVIALSVLSYFSARDGTLVDES